MNRKILLVTCFLMIVCTGCGRLATQSLSYTPPLKYNFENEKIVNIGYEKIWNTYVKKLTESEFTIEQLDKNSRLITISFYSNNPEKYIDCGTMERESKLYSEIQNHKYNIAENTKFKLTYHQEGALKQVDKFTRETHTKGTINIYLSPITKNKTKIITKAKYILNIKEIKKRVKYFSIDPLYTMQDYPTEYNTREFTTNEQHLKEYETEEITFNTQCIANGALENRILSMIQ